MVLKFTSLNSKRTFASATQKKDSKTNFAFKRFFCSLALTLAVFFLSFSHAHAQCSAPTLAGTTVAIDATGTTTIDQALLGTLATPSGGTCATCTELVLFSGGTEIPSDGSHTFSCSPANAFQHAAGSYNIGVIDLLDPACGTAASAPMITVAITFTDAVKPTWDDPTPVVGAPGVISSLISITSEGRRLDVVLDCNSSTYAADLAYWSGGGVGTFQPTASDNCDPSPTVIHQAGSVAPLAVCEGRLGQNNIYTKKTAHWEAIDGSGNQLEDSGGVDERFTVRIFTSDSEAPSFDPTDAGVTLPSFIAATTQSVNAYSADPIGTILNMSTYYNNTALDPAPCGILFGAPGDIINPPTLSVTAADCTNVTYLGWTVVEDLGNTVPLGITSGGLGSQDASQLYPPGTYTITHTAEDLSGVAAPFVGATCGNQSTITYTFTVVDDLSPVVANCVALADITDLNDPSNCDNTLSWPSVDIVGSACAGPLSQFTITATATLAGNPNASIAINVNQSGNPGNLDFADFPVGVTTITYSIKDAFGNTETCPSFDVTILDDEAPSITCPADQDLLFGACDPTATLIPDYHSLFNTNPIDNCPTNYMLSQIPAAGTPLSAATVDGDMMTIQLIITDGGPLGPNNSGTFTCDFDITLLDVSVPIPTLPGIVLAPESYQCGAQIIDAPTAQDPCGGLLYGVPFPNTGTTPVGPGPNFTQYEFAVGSYVFDWVYTDPGTGFQALQSQQIDIIGDVIDPSIAATGITLELDANGQASLSNVINNSLDPGTLVNIDDGTTPPIDLGFTFNFYGLPQTQVRINGNGFLTFFMGDLNTIPFFDSFGNFDLDFQFATDPNMIAFAWDDLDAGGNGGGTISYSTGGTAPNRYFTVTFEGVEHWNGFAAGPDPSAPTVTIQCVLNESGLIEMFSTNVETDGFGMTQGVMNGNLGLPLDATMTPGRENDPWTATNDYAAFIPVGATYVSSTVGSFDPIPSVPVTTADNCGVDLSTLALDGLSTINFDCGDIGINNIALTVDDLSGNTGTTTMPVLIVDNIAPIIVGTPGNLLVDCDNIPPAQASNAFVVIDNCNNGLSVVLNETTTKSGNSSSYTDYNYTITRVWTATDNSGNATSVTQQVTVVDDEAPVFDAGLIATMDLNTNPNDCHATISLSVDASDVSDNCADFSALIITNDSPYGVDGLANASGNYPVGTHTVTFTALDPSHGFGHNVVANYQVTITVEDNTPPIASCNPLTLGIPDNGSGLLYLNAAMVDNGSTDNCGVITSRTVFPNIFNCSHVGTTQTIFLTVTDDANNNTTCSTTLTIQDNNPPQALCVGSLSVELDQNGSASITAAMVDDGSFDDCTAITMSISNSTFDFSDVGTTNTVFLTVLDAYNNPDVCSVNVNVTTPETCFDIGQQVGAEQQTVQVPVYASDFTAINGFQFTLQMANPFVGDLVNITNVHSSISAQGSPTTFIDGNDELNITWFNNNSANPITLIAGTKLFDVQVTLTGNIGDNSDILVNAASAVNPEVVQNFGGANTLIFNPCFNTNEITGSVGNVEITSVAQLTVAGEIFTWYGAGGWADEFAQDVTVDLSTTLGTPMGTEVTGADGSYSFFPILSNNSYKVTPSKDFDWNNGTDVSDLQAIQENNVGSTLFTSNYQKIAADVSNDGIVSVFDVVLLQQTLNTLFTSDPTDFVPPSYPFPSPNCWKFVDTLDQLDMNIPLTMLNRNTVPAYSSMVTLGNLGVDTFNVDFYAVKTGDVDGTANPDAFIGGVDSDSRGLMLLSVKDQAIKTGETYQIDIRTKGFNNVRSFQWVIGFDSDVLSFENVETGSLNNLSQASFGHKFIEEGVLVNTWFSNNGSETLSEEEILYTLEFTAKEDAASLKDLLSIKYYDVLPTKAYTSKTEFLDVEFEFEALENVIMTNDFSLLQNTPNPFKEFTVIGFNLPEATHGSISIMDASGRVLKVIENDFAKGYNEIEIQKDDLSSAGLLFYQLETADNKATRRMIILE